MEKLKISIVGCGPGDVRLLTDAARVVVASADVIAGAPHLLELFQNGKAERIGMNRGVAALLDEIEARRNDGKRVAVLVSGDPGVYSLAKNVRSRFGSDSCETVPGISSVQLACAKVGASLQDLRIVSAHGREPEVETEELAEREAVAVLCGGGTGYGWIEKCFAALRESHACWLCHELSLPGETVSRIDSCPSKERLDRKHTLLLFVKNQDIDGKGI